MYYKILISSRAAGVWLRLCCLVLHFLKFFQGREESAISCCDCVDLASGKAVGEQNGVDDEAAITGEIVTMGT